MRARLSDACLNRRCAPVSRRSQYKPASVECDSQSFVAELISAAEYQPDENCEDAIEVFELGMEGLKIAIEESRLYIFDPVTDPVRHQSLS